VKPQIRRPLDVLRVLDLSRALSGPFAGRVLADLGADVVKVELPGADMRQLAACFCVADPDPGRPLEAKLRARARIIAEWIAGHDDREAPPPGRPRTDMLR
jgi:crotonobetainyl-CoA:carnitine CoA-transferase CaiB-like acyl-CoA transferase